MQQTGLIVKPPSPTDYIAGANTKIVYEERISDWSPWLPTEERQSKDFAFDTMSCVSFSAHNVIETQIKWLLENKKFTPSQVAVLTEFFDEKGNFNCSDRFTAIMSGTTINGNYFQKVWDCIRHNGLLPEKDLPFGGNSFGEYHNPAVITPAMKEKAKRILSIIDFQYEFVFYDEDPDLSDDQLKMIRTHIKQSPLQVATPVPGRHAIMLHVVGKDNVWLFDTYKPFVKKKSFDSARLHYGMKGYVMVKSPMLKLGSKGKDVELLQQDLNALNNANLVTDGDFGKKTEKAVIDFQAIHGLVADGIVGQLTFNKIAELKKFISERKWLELAFKDLGVKELTVGDNPKILAYFDDVGHDWVQNDETAWCAAFLGSCLERAKFKSTRSLSARSYLKWGKETTDPKIGDIAVFSRPPVVTNGHVGFFMRQTNDRVWVLGGNQTDQVSITSFPRNLLLGFRRV